MPVEGFNARKCQARNRIAARRDNINAVPMLLLAGAPAVTADAELHYAQGSLPATPEAALLRINALLPENAAPLTPDDVYLHYVEAGNGAFVAKYHVFLGDTTLRNITQDATAGFAFMNSHRTGSMSTPTELPFGRTFAGRYEQFRAAGDGVPVRRALLGFYMLRGVAPNGSAGPTTDALDAAIRGGTLFDVSLGLGPGQEVCDICGNDLESPDCGHIPGTTQNLSADQRTAQRARGVPGGMASYTLHDAHAGEFSGVYDGAVPGAGFRKTLTRAKAGTLTPLTLVQARHAYATLLRKGDLPMDEYRDLLREELATALQGVPGLAVSELRPAPDPGVEAALSVANARNTQLEARLAQIETTARLDYVKGLVLSNRLLPARREWALTRLTNAAADDARLPDPIGWIAPDGTAHTGTRVEAVKAELEAAPPHTFTKETIALGSLIALDGSPPPQEADAALAATVAAVTSYATAANGHGPQEGKR